MTISPMAAQHDIDLDVDGDSLEQLPQSSLQDLELNALSSTQREAAALSSTQQEVAALRQWQFQQTTRPLKLTRPSLPPVTAPVPVSTTAPANALGSTTLHANALGFADNAPLPTIAPTSSQGTDYGMDFDIDDEQVLDLNALTQNYNPTLHSNHSNNNPTPAEPILQDHVPPNYEDVDQVVAPDHTNDLVRRLQSELDALRLSLQNLHTEKQKLAGELSIVRAKAEKLDRDHKNQMLALNKSRADDAAKLKADLDAKEKVIEAQQTDKRFLEHDLAQARDERSKRLKPTRPAAIKITRQASQSLPYRDGFDDNEIVTLSPSKPKDTFKSSTPKVGEKRKRNAVVSPAPRLQVNPQTSVSSSPAANVAESTALVKELIRPQDDLQFQMIRRLMNHRPPNSRERVLETLSRLALPSLPEQSISGLITEGLSQFVGIDEHDDFSTFACDLFSDLWERCLLDKMYTPVYLILDLYEFVLSVSLERPKLSLVQRFLPLATKTIDLVAVPRVRLPLGSEVDPHLLECINIDQILLLMHSMAFDASLDTESCQAFWKKMEFDFTLMMLNKSQPLPQIMLVLQMLGSSAMSGSFSIILDDPEKQTTLEGHTIDRLTTLLFERPETPPGELPYEDVEVTALQIETIRVLNGLAATKHGSEVLAQHRTAIGRLFRLLHVSVTKLYDVPPTSRDVLSETTESTGFSTAHELSTSLVNLTVRLIYHLLINHGDMINLREKLMVIPGGHHKFLVSLTRLAFSEQLVYEAGLDNEALDAAHEILDGILSPEEGEAVVQAIETPRGTTGTRVSAYT